MDLTPTLYELARLKPTGKPTGASLARLVGRITPPRPGSAWADNTGGERALYRGEREDLDSLLVFDPPAGEWIPRRVALDVSGDELGFEARSFEEPRRLAVRQGDAVLSEIPLTPDWTPVRLPASGRLHLEADGCKVAAPKERWDFRCYAFQVRGLRLARVELYDVSEDPAQRRDLSRDETRTTRTLLKDLTSFNPHPVAAASAPPLDPELEKQLRALGYLQ